MPLVDARRVEPALNTNIGSVPLPEDIENHAPAPTLLSTIGAAFSADNTIVNAITYVRDHLATPNEVEQGYNPWSDIKGTPYEDHWSSFTSSNNPRYTAMLKQRIDQEEDNRRTVAAAGMTGTIASIAASVLDPTILIPVGGEVAAAGKGSYAIGRAAVRVGAVAGVSTAVQEGALQATQEIRTGEESAINIGASVVLGGLLGGGVKLLTRGQQDTAAAALHGIVTSRPGSIGAAAVERATLADLSVAGDVTSRVAEATKAISPNLRANFRESAAAREASQQLAENSLYQTMHGEGRSLGAAAETLARSTYNARMVDGVTQHNVIYAEMKKSGVTMSRQDFEEAIGDAMRNGDVGANDFVSRAAKAWRERVFEPFKNEAVNLGLLPEDVGVDTAASYFSRVWNREALTAREPEFKDIVAAHYGDQIATDYAGSVDALKTRLGTLDQELADLRLPADQRAAAMTDIETAADKLDAANGDQIDRVTRMNELRRQAREAEKGGNLTAARDARSQAAAVAAAGCGRWHMLADGDPAWLLAWRHRQAQPQPAPAPKASPPAPPVPKATYAPRDTFAFPATEGADMLGMIEPKRWDYDGCVRREPVLDADVRPPRVVRKVGWQRCMKCSRPFFSEDVVRLRLCSGAEGCRGDEDRFR